MISVTGQDSGAGSPCRGGQKKDVTDGATQTGKEKGWVTVLKYSIIETVR